MAYLATNTFPGTGAVMQVAISFAGNRPDASSGTVAYFDPANVKAEIVKPATATTNEVVTAVALTQVNASTFRTAAVVPVGSILRVYRETLVSYPMVDFADRQTVTENDLDTSSRQVLYAAMEALDKSNLAIDYARQGLTYAVTAVNTANTALDRSNAAATAASNAVTTANAASTNAATAVRTANLASTSADAALVAAKSADQHATNVETLAAAAQQSAANAVTIANQAKATADGIDAKATNAQSQASTAVTTANQAAATANGIDAKATSAVTTANDASSKAASAKATAEGVDAKATAAQSQASDASSKADQAISTANQANTTASNQAAAVAKAQGDATAAGNAASAANSNANGRVSRSGDTLTGQLSAPAFLSGDLYLSGNGFGQQNNGRISLSGTGANFFGLNAVSIYNDSTIFFNAKSATGNNRGYLYNQAEGHWNIQTASGKNWAFANDGVSYFPDSIRVSQSGGIFTAIISGRNLNTNGPELVSTTVPNISSGTGSHYAAAALKVTNGGNNSASASMVFHREGAFACYFGLDVDNELAYGGYSYGAIRYRIWSERNFNPAEYVRFDNLRQELGGRGAGEVGTYAFLWCNGNYDPGSLVGGGSLYWGSYDNKGGAVGGGTWRCMGFGRGDKATLWLRVN